MMTCDVLELKKGYLGLKRLVKNKELGTTWITLKIPPLSLCPTLEGGVATHICTHHYY